MRAKVMEQKADNEGMSKNSAYHRVFRAIKQTTQQASSLREYMTGPRVYRPPGKDDDTRAIAHLQRLSKKVGLGDNVAAHLLMVIATEATYQLNAAVADQPELFHEMARKVPGLADPLDLPSPHQG